MFLHKVCNLFSSRQAKLTALLLVLVSHTFAQAQSNIPGYTYGTKALQKSPVSLEDLKKLKQTMLITDEDVKYLRKSSEVLLPQTEQILDTWYGFVGGTPQLLQYFSSKKGKPDGKYLDRVRKRFGKWISDTTDANFDQDWLNYQHEIGLRHHRIAKNKTDNAKAVDHIHFRYLSALVIPVTTTLKPYLAKGKYKNDPETVDKMHQAWVKSVLLQTILWSYPYINDGEF